MADIPQELDWITVRAKCSLAHVFELLKDSVKEDVDRQNALPEHDKFEVTYGGNSFTVITHDSGTRAVIFALTKTHIEIKDANRVLLFQAGITLNDAGRCMLEVDKKEMELWQVRRRALEKLFFQS